MKRSKLQLKKLTLRVLLDESSLSRVAGGLTAFTCTGGPFTVICPSAACITRSGCSAETFDGHCTYDGGTIVGTPTTATAPPGP